MHLEDVTIEGFKSFSEPTNMGFQPGIGVIIGNNGVGKSNILDAIVWALGEDDLERLRCKDVDELFFSGSKSYPPANRIRVELKLKEGPERKAPMKTLARELARNGGRSYWIQGEHVDGPTYAQQLRELGLGKTLKTIIRQEQINDMISLDAGQRFRWVQGLLEDGAPEIAANCLKKGVNARFQEYLSTLLAEVEAQLDVKRQDGGGELEVEVAFQKKSVRRAHQLSGGQRAVTSLALKLALFEELDSPFYLLDEVEPSLDYTNHKSMQALLKMLAKERQLIMITHLRSTIELANTVHGVRTRMDGSSFMKFYFLMDERLLRLYKCCG
jgi:chromosome segregation protein